MDKLWKSKVIGKGSELKEFNCSVKAVWLYASERHWASVHRQCLQRIMKKNTGQTSSVARSCGEKLISWASAEPDTTKKVDLAGAHSTKVRWQHCQLPSKFPVDATRPQKRTTKEHMEERSGEERCGQQDISRGLGKMEAEAQNRDEDGE